MSGLRATREEDRMVLDSALRNPSCSAIADRTSVPV
jgi:hypothetical protein